MRYSPGDLSVRLPDIADGDALVAVSAADKAFSEWRRTSLDERIAHLRDAGQRIAAIKDELAHGITIETGKPITEATAEVGFVVAKIELAIADAKRYLAEFSEADNARPNVVRRRPRGVAAVIGPFNFPIHLAHGAIVAYLLAGNTVIFKPSPFAAGVCGSYGKAMAQAFPPGVFGVVQGGVAIGQALVSDPRVRSICFTGSVNAGRAIARACVDDVSKDVALELGGKNAAIVCGDADLDLAATAIVDAAIATTGQRCNSTSRVLVDSAVAADLIDRLRSALAQIAPGDPLETATRLGPLISAESADRFACAIALPGDWLTPGQRIESISTPIGTAATKRGHYVTPALLRLTADEAPSHPLFRDEVFAPLLTITSTTADAQAIALSNATPFGLTASVFTRDAVRFGAMADELNVGNVYHDLPTTLSPGTLPFGGHANSGNGHPGGRGFIRFATDEQVIQRRE
ncbi:MAG: Succinylglutamic semialdehyde dehydrogenase [Phycisphaerales bacterium]|nr:Succinylglutamic semialdehyde dehydrogenase [Phycisphaerales bacterium]